MITTVITIIITSRTLQARNASGDFPPVSFKPLEEACKTQTEKLQPMVYDLELEAALLYLNPMAKPFPSTQLRSFTP